MRIRDGKIRIRDKHPGSANCTQITNKAADVIFNNKFTCQGLLRNFHLSQVLHGHSFNLSEDLNKTAIPTCLPTIMPVLIHCFSFS